MKSTGTITVDHDSAHLIQHDAASWQAAKLMTEEEIHAAALSDPDAQPLPLPGGDWTGLTKGISVKKLRERLGISQEEFASTYRIPLGTLRDWEQKRKKPDATARAYLIVIDKDPKTVAALLNAA